MDEPLTTVQACHTTGMTYRQADHWTSQGWVRPRPSSPGSGFQRMWPPDEVRVAYVMSALNRAGVSPAKAARPARYATVEQGRWHVVLEGRVKASGRLPKPLRP